jgi:hypothetical protein
MINKIIEKLPWIPVEIKDTQVIPKGDMPGDKVNINEGHIIKSRVIFPELLKLLVPVLQENTWQRAVVAVCGGSGVGKSETASLISYYLNDLGLGSYTLSGDNYPHRIPKYNDAERLRIFRKKGIDGLVSGGQYNKERQQLLEGFQKSNNDANPELVNQYPWLSVYQLAGRNGLKNYLGTSNEIDFTELTGIVSQFKNGASRIFLKRMGREEHELWYEAVDFSRTNVLVIEWTHGNSDYLQGVDVPVLLNSTPQETLEHRRSRNRDGATDSPFTTMVLEIEQGMLVSQAIKAKIILSKKGELLAYSDFVRLMSQ